MVSREELLFTEGLISALSLLEVEKIPFANDRFRKGVERLKEFFEGMTGSKESYRDIKTIFAKRPISGDYERMKQALESHNGSTISFTLSNPKWERANINVPYFQAKKILSEPEYGIPEDTMLAAARAFCSGADIAR